MRRKTAREVLKGTGTVSEVLRGSLKAAGFLEAIESINTPRFWRYVEQPASLLRHGWRLSVEKSENSALVYRIGEAPRVGTRMFVSPGQTLILDRKNRVAVLLSFANGEAQEIRVDLKTRKVVQDRWLAA